MTGGRFTNPAPRTVASWATAVAIVAVVVALPIDVDRTEFKLGLIAFVIAVMLGGLVVQGLLRRRRQRVEGAQQESSGGG